jgi:hypothetical protein
MRKIILAAITAATISAQEPITNYVANIPTFATCKEALDLTKRPTLTPEAAAVKDSDGNPVYSIANAVNIDIQSGWVKYRLMHGSTLFEEITAPVPACTQEDTAAIQQAIANAGNFDEKLDLLIAALPATTAAIDAKIDANNTVSSSISQSFRLIETNNGGAKNQFFNEFFQKFKSVWNYIIYLVGIIGVAAGFVILVSNWLFQTNGKGGFWGFVGENAPRLGGGVIVLWLFMGSAGNGLSPAHAIWGWMVTKGDQLASVASGAATISEVKRTIKNSALADLRRKVETAAKENAKLNRELPIVSQVLIGCTNQYNIEALTAEGKKANGSIFPSNLDGSKENDFYASYLKINNTPGALVWLTGKEPFYSLDTCSKAETAFIEGRNKFTANQKVIDNAKNVNLPQLQTYTQTVIQNAKQNGWVGIALLPAQRAIARSADSLIEKNMAQSGLNFGGMSDLNAFERIYQGIQNWDLQKTAESLLGRATLLLVPGAQTFYGTSQDAIRGTIDLITLKFRAPAAGAKAAADQSGGAGAVVTLGGASAASGAVAAGLTIYESVRNIIASVGAFFIATEIGKIILDSLPFVVCVGVAGVVIALYYAELLFFTLALPFAGAVAFWSGQSSKVVEIGFKGLVVATKPILIVVSVYVAVYTADMLHGLTYTLVETQNAMLLKTASTAYTADTNWLTGLGSYLVAIAKAGLIKGILLIGGAVFETYVVAKIIISGPSMFWQYLRDNTPDAGHLVEGIVTKGARYEKGI